VRTDKLADGPLSGVVNVTFTPAIGFPLRSRTVAVSGRANPLFTRALCEAPPVALTSASLEMFVRTNEAGVAAPATLAVTAYVPAAFPAIALTLARPLWSVTSVLVNSRAVAPLVGALKFTVAPPTGLP
jgi:hypothetical protein